MDGNERVALALEALAKKIEELIDFQRTMIPVRLVYPLMLAMFLSFAGGAGVKALYQSLGVPILHTDADKRPALPMAGDHDPSGDAPTVSVLARDNQS